MGLFSYSDWFLRKSISKFDERKFLGCHVPERYEGFCREFRKSLTRFNVLISEEHSSRFSLKSNKSVTQSVRLGDSRKNKPSFSASRNSVFAPHLSACQCGLSNLVLYLGFWRLWPNFTASNLNLNISSFIGNLQARVEVFAVIDDDFNTSRVRVLVNWIFQQI